MKVLVFSLLLVLLLAPVAEAAGPYPHHVESGNTDVLVTLIEKEESPRPLSIDLLFPDADVTVSFWTWNISKGITQLGGDQIGDVDQEGDPIIGDRVASCDSVVTIPAGFKLEATHKAAWVYIQRNGTTSGDVHVYF